MTSSFPQTSPPPASDAVGEAVPHAGADQPAYRSVGAHLRLWTIAAAGLSIDLWSKNWAFSSLAPDEMREFIPGVLHFHRSVNSGALFGMGKGMVPLFIAASIVALVIVFYLFATSDRRRWVFHLALSFVVAGSLGNLYDRSFVIADRITTASGVSFLGKVVADEAGSEVVMIGHAPDGAEPRPYPRDEVTFSQIGVVRDFLKIMPQVYGRDVWPWVFNIADSLLVAAVILFLLNFWSERGVEAAAARSGGSADTQTT